jgi:Zn-dependent protease with chaperone function
MQIINAEGALATLLNIMAVPGAFLTFFGAFSWYKGWKLGIENRARAGKMLFMFGLILLVIVLILSFFISQDQEIQGVPTSS